MGWHIGSDWSPTRNLSKFAVLQEAGEIPPANAAAATSTTATHTEVE
jgi:hypothetical protein